MYFLSDHDIPLDPHHIHYLQTNGSVTDILKAIRYGSKQHPPRFGRHVDVLWNRPTASAEQFLRTGDESNSINVTFHSITADIMEYVQAGVIDDLKRRRREPQVLIVAVINEKTLEDCSLNTLHRNLRNVDTALREYRNAGLLLIAENGAAVDDRLRQYFAQHIRHDAETNQYTMLASGLNEIEICPGPLKETSAPESLAWLEERLKNTPADGSGEPDFFNIWTGQGPDSSKQD